MAQWDFNDGIIPFVGSLIIYGLYFFLPRSFEPWKEAKRELTTWREYEVSIGAPNDEVEQHMADEAFCGLIAPVLRQGFEPVGDYVLTAGGNYNAVKSVSSAPLASPDAVDKVKEFVPFRFGISRVFEHKRLGCIAVVTSSSLLNVEEAVVSVQIISSGDGWIYTSYREQAMSYHIGQGNRDLKSHHGRISFKTLLEEHLRCREEIARVGNFSWGEVLTFENILVREEEYAKAVRDFARSHSPLSLLIFQWRHKGYGDWLGELTGKVSLPKSSPQ